MTTITVPALRRPGGRQAAVILVVAALAWVATVVLAVGMDQMTGTMGLGVAGFVGLWTVMMVAMMLPAVAPTASLYVRTVRDARSVRVAGYVAGYVLVWAGAGFPAFALAAIADRLATAHPTGAHVTAVAIFAAAGIYQLTPLKERCLGHCRSPLSLLMHYGSYRGRSRDIRAGAHHGLYCVACCWTLMVVLIAVGIMNLWVMAALAGLTALEKLWSRGPAVAKAAGVVAIGLAVGTVWAPGLAPALHQTMMRSPM